MGEHQINFRLDDEYNQKLENVSAIEEKKPSAMAQEMVKESLNFWWKKKKRHDIPVPIAIMKIYMDMIDISKIKNTDLDNIADFMFSEIQAQVNKVTFSELVTRMKRFNAKIETTLGVFTEKSDGETEENKFYGHTKLGKNWNYIQSEIYSRLFSKLDIEVLSKDSDSMGYSIVIKKKTELL